MRIGAIDLGTNSCRMLLADYSQGKVKEVKKELRIVRLGEGVDRNRHLSTEAAERALQVILEFVEEMKAHSVEAITIIGTSALRDVNNAFLLAEEDPGKNRPGIKYHFRGRRGQAELSWGRIRGGWYSCPDIGGGSTEFIWQDEGGKLNYRSLDMGAVRMTERHIRDVEKEISAEELQLIEEDVRRTMEGKLKDIPVNIHRAVGLGGTITTLAAIDQGLEEYDSARIHGYLLHRKQIEGILQRLAELNLQERRKIRGLEPGRADIITAGTKILATIMDILVIESVRASEQDLFIWGYY